MQAPSNGLCLACLKAPLRNRSHVLCHPCYKNHGELIRGLEQAPATLSEIRARLSEQRFQSNRNQSSRAWIAYASYLLAQAGDEECLLHAREHLPQHALNPGPEAPLDVPPARPTISALEETLGGSNPTASDLPGPLRTKDGHWVRSKSEREIANFLFEHKIRYVYERRIRLNGVDLRPDFFLPDVRGGLYLEHFGLDTPEYLRRANDRVLRFKEAGLLLVATSEKDASDMEAALQRKLRRYFPNLDFDGNDVA